MGAIFGIVGEGSVAEVQAMGDQAAHRGRFQRVWSPAPGVYLGQASHRPFEADERTPMATDWNVQGGGAAFPERFSRLGHETLAGLRGTFAIALSEGPNRVMLAVDQVGYKSLFYTVLRGRFAFASEYKSLLALTDLPREPDRTAIQHYLSTKYPLGGRSFLARVRALQGGHMLEYRDGTASVSTYWRPLSEVVHRSREEHVAVVRAALLETVHRQIHTYEHVGITLGGGLDAALVLGAMRRVAPDVRISSFTVGAGEKDWEVVGARQTAQEFGTEHHEYLFDPTTIRRLLNLRWERTRPDEVEGTVEADAFCHSMVRALVASLLMVGDGRRPAEFPAEVLGSRTRHPGVNVVPPHGLSLEEVRYPADSELAARALEARRIRTLC